MSHTHLLYHIIYGTKNRLPLISESWEPDFYKQMGGIVRNHQGIPIEINGMPDHLHMLVRIKPVITVADFLRQTKAISSGWIRRAHEPKFRWQRRYGAFSVSESVSEAVRKYIRNQKSITRNRRSKTNIKSYCVCIAWSSMRNICGSDVRW